MNIPYSFNEYLYHPDDGLQFRGTAIHLPPKEREVLAYLLSARGRVVRKEELVSAVWGEALASDESISRTIYRLRCAMQKVGGPDSIQTVYNTGFRIRMMVRAHLPNQVLLVGHGRHSRHSGAMASLLAARDYLARRSPADVQAAAQCAQYATTLDPQFAAAWAVLAEIRVFEAQHALRPPRDAGWLAHQAASAALTLDPECTPALACRGWVNAMIDQNVVAGMVDLQRALQLEPDDWRLHCWHAWALQASGRRKDAVVALQRATELNAMGPGLHALLAQFQLLAGELERAQATALHLAKQFSTIEQAQAVACTVLAACGRNEEALLFGERAAAGDATPALLAPLAYALAASGQTDAARSLLARIESAPTAQPSACMAPIYLALGEIDRALDMLHDARERGVPQFAWTRDDPRLAPLRGHPRANAIWGVAVPDLRLVA